MPHFMHDDHFKQVLGTHFRYDGDIGIFHSAPGAHISIYCCNVVIRIITIKLAVPVAGIMEVLNGVFPHFSIFR